MILLFRPDTREQQADREREREQIQRERETERESERGWGTDRQQQTGDLQKGLCAAFSKFYPFVECGLVLGGATVYLDFIDRPLLQISEGQTIEVIFTRTTDMRHVDKCFRGPKTSFEDDMRDERPGE